MSTTRKPSPAKSAPTRRKPQASVRATKPRAAKPRSAETKPAAPAPTHEQIAARAYDLFVLSGYRHGAELEHWLQAEAELSSPQPLAEG